MASAPEIRIDTQLAVKSSSLISANPEQSETAMNTLLSEQEVTGLRDLLNRKEDIKYTSIFRTTNGYPHVCLRMLSMLAELEIVLRNAGASTEVVEFGMRRFLDLSGGKKIPMVRPEVILEEARRAGVNENNVQLRRQNLRRAIDSGLGRSTFLRQTVVPSNDGEISTRLNRTSTEASSGSPIGTLTRQPTSAVVPAASSEEAVDSSREEAANEPERITRL